MDNMRDMKCLRSIIQKIAPKGHLHVNKRVSQHIPNDKKITEDRELSDDGNRFIIHEHNCSAGSQYNRGTREANCQHS